MIIYCKQDGSVQSVPAVIPQGSLREPVTVLAPAPSAVCSLRIMPASHEALDPVIATGMEIDGEFRAYSLHLPPTVTEWPGVCRYQVMFTDANGRQTASYSGTFTIQRGAVDPDLIPADVGELGNMSLGDLLTLLSGLQTAGIATQTQVDAIQKLIDEGKIGGDTDTHPSPSSVNPVESGGTYSAFQRTVALIAALALTAEMTSAFRAYANAAKTLEQKTDAVLDSALFAEDPSAAFAEYNSAVAAHGTAADNLLAALNRAPVTRTVATVGTGANVSPMTVTAGLSAVITVTPDEGLAITEISATMSGEELPTATVEDGRVLVYTPAGSAVTGDITIQYTAEERPSEPLVVMTVNGQSITAYTPRDYIVGGVKVTVSLSAGLPKITVSAADGYRLASCLINGASVTEYIVQDEAVTITATAVRTYSVTFSGTGCAAYTDATGNEPYTVETVDENESVSLWLTPAIGYDLTAEMVTVSGLSSVVKRSEGGGITVIGTATGNVTITATAVSNSVTLTVSTTNAYIRLGDSSMVLQPITPGMAIPAHRGQNLVMEVVPDDGYTLQSVVGDGVNLGNFTESGAKRVYSITVTGKADGTATITATAVNNYATLTLNLGANYYATANADDPMQAAITSIRKEKGEMVGFYIRPLAGAPLTIDAFVVPSGWGKALSGGTIHVYGQLDEDITINPYDYSIEGGYIVIHRVPYAVESNYIIIK